MLTHTGTSGQASSPPPAHMDSHQVNEKIETVLFQLRHVTRERDELRKRLALSSPGTTFDDCRYCSDLMYRIPCFPKQTFTEKRSNPVYTCTLWIEAFCLIQLLKATNNKGRMVLCDLPCGVLKLNFSPSQCCPLLPPLWNRPNTKASHDYERLKLQCMKAMADLQSLQNQHSTTLKRCEEAVKKADFYQWVESPTTRPFVNFLIAGAFVLYAFAISQQGFSWYSVLPLTYSQQIA